jgi:pilus assembly protein FimV
LHKYLMLRSKDHIWPLGTSVAETHDRQQRKATFSMRKIALAVAVAASALSATPTWAAGLGRLTVQSALGQPLRAEVEITALAREEANSLSVKLAPPEAFRAAGLEYNPALANLRFAVDRRADGRPFVRITSASPVNEPFVDLLVELNWATGKFVREYTFLLDPPELKLNRETDVAASPVPATSAPSSTPAAPAAGQSAAGVVNGNSARSSAPAARPEPVARPSAPSRPAPVVPAEATPVAGSDVVVRPGDTLAGIAARTKPAAIALDQAVVAIYRANPSAFFGSVHQLRSGATLKVPDSSAMAAIDPAEARKEVRVKTADFGAYKGKLAATPRTLESSKAGQSASGEVNTAVEAPGSKAAAADKLKLSRSGAGKAAAGGTGAADGVARDAALNEAQSRVKELERNVADLQKLVELKNKQLADLQKLADAAKVTPVVPPVAKVETPKVESPPMEPPKAEAPKVDAPKPAEAPVASAPSAAEAPKAEAPKTEAPKEDAPKEAAVAEAPKAAEPPKPAPVAAAPAPAPAPEPSLIDEVLDNPFALPGIGAVVVAGAGLAFWTMRRRRKEEKFEDSLTAAEAFTANSLFGSTGGQSVDTSNSLFTSTGRDGGDVHSTEVDPIAEAEVYIAYGRESQAEEILKEALKKQPERQAIRLKLMEIYAGRKDPVAFGAVAQDMYNQTGGQNEEWPKVVTLGLSIDPDNPLYTGAAPASNALAATPAAPASPSVSAMGVGAGVVAAAGASIAAAVASKSAALPELKAEPAADPLEVPAFEIPPIEEPAPSQAAMPDMLDFDFGAGATTVEKASAKLVEPAGSSDTALADAVGDRFELPSLDLPASALEPAVDETPVFSDSAIADLGELKIELPAVQASSEPAAIDLSSIGLDLQPTTLSTPSSADSARWQEMATKLDLAAAYEEIGDKEGARELLDEVVRGGDSDQQQKARTMLSKIN